MNESLTNLTPLNSDLNDIKKEFYAYRNGIVADTLRKAGLPHKYIFGLQIPQLTAIANKRERNKTLAKLLWDDIESREARLLAAYLFPPDQISIDEARQLISGIKSREEAEIMAFRLLRFLPFARDLATTPFPEGLNLSEFGLYCLEMLNKNLESQK